jgi:biotin transport system substrate-specific component
MNAATTNATTSSALRDASGVALSPLARIAALHASVRLLLSVLLWVCISTLASQAAFYLPGNPVPLTLQTAAVLACGLLCSPRVALASMLSYVGLGLAGAPVFAGFAGGPAVAVSASAGYLAAFVIAAPLMSLLARRSDGRVRGALPVFFAGLVCHALILAIGTAGLKGRLALPWEAAFAIGAVPFVVGSVIKSAMVAAVPAR